MLNYSERLQRVFRKTKIELGSRIVVRKRGVSPPTVPPSVFEGLLMPGSGDMIVIKLDNGYNIGIRFGRCVKIEKAKQTKIMQKETIQGKKSGMQKGFDKSKPIISILHTGGTIASRVDYRTGGVVSSFTPEDLMSMFPELSQMANIRTRLIFSMSSEDMRFSHYQILAKEIAKEIKNGADGVILAHGTDTMHYTSAALSFMLQNLPVPVILVGAQRSSDRGSTDAAENLINAAYFISQTDFSGVAICMHENPSNGSCLILPACKARKMHTSRRDAFRPINSFAWARVDHSEKKIEFIKKDYMKKDKNRKIEVKAKMEEKVALIKTSTNMDSSLIDFFVKKGYKGLILEGTGLGHAPAILFNSLKKAVREGVVVCMASQTIYGRVNMNVYSPGRDLLKIGIIPCKDMLPETAFIKLSWLLGNFPKKAKELMGKNLVGEISEKTEAEAFLN